MANNGPQLAYVNPLDRQAECFSESLYTRVVQRIRRARTIFGDNIKLSFRQVDEDHWAHLPLPHLLVVPTTSRGNPTTPPERLEEITITRIVTMIAQFDGRASEHEWMAVNDIEAAEKELLGCLLGWKPVDHFKPTLYGGMRVMGAKLPHVKVTFAFTFTETIEPEPQEADIDGEPIDPNPCFIVKPVDYTCCIPCEEPEPEECV